MSKQIYRKPKPSAAIQATRPIQQQLEPLLNDIDNLVSRAQALLPTLDHYTSDPVIKRLLADLASLYTK